MSHPCRIPKKYYDEVVESDPTLAKSNFPAAFERWIEMLKAGKEAGSRLETSLHSSISSKPEEEPASPVTKSVTESVTKSVTYDWTQVPECPLRYEEGNICFYKKPGRKAIMEHVEPWMCQRCEHTLKINQKVAEIENEVTQQRVRRLDWLNRHQAEKSQQKEEPEKKVESPEESQPSQPKFIPRRLADLGGPDGY